ncbi:hypothetical protein JNB91_03970 [Rhizobium wenxiniae]|uniref:hypothetical protein n=1 Tax=Rhizobium wenxiniae TaxID=1737357 RepID=UPI001C6E1861|nr:hypothetical protein [Rhizobium wenxiniae]MBW9086995.1 hypothetical protein [Rhizobium wenxiniae]
MYGRLGSIYLLHLTEAGAQRRRLTQAHPGAHRAGSVDAGMSLPMLFRLAAVLGVGFCAIAALAVMVG